MLNLVKGTMLAAMLAIAGCAATADVAGVRPAHRPSPVMAQFSLRDCTAVGGKLRKLGRAQTTTCVIPYLDAGKACHDSAECMGSCVAPPSTAGTRVKGTCSQDSGATFGCYSEVRQGRALPGICVD